MKTAASISSVVLFFLFLFSSCKKDKEATTPNSGTVAPPASATDTTVVNIYTNDTVFTSDYLMAYPGSQWHYDDGTTESCHAYEQVAIAALTHNGANVTITKTYKILPNFSLFKHFVMGSEIVNTNDPNKTKIYPIVQTAIGEFYNNSDSFGAGTMNAGSNETHSSVTELLDEMTVSGITYNQVIHVHTTTARWYYHNPQAPFPYPCDYYFAKNVGLIRSEVSSINNPELVIKNLVNYQIGPH